MIANALMEKYYSIHDRIKHIHGLLEGEIVQFDKELNYLSKHKSDISVIQKNLLISFNENFSEYNKNMNKEIKILKSNIAYAINLAEVANINEEGDNIIIDSEEDIKERLLSFFGIVFLLNNRLII
jgi:hypothetical protein